METNRGNGFEEFRTVLFGGYRKGDVIEYIEYLTNEIESVRMEKKLLEREMKEKDIKLTSLQGKTGKNNQSSGRRFNETENEDLYEKEREIQRLQNMCVELRTANERSQEKIQRLEEENSDAKERLKSHNADKTEEYKALTNQLKEKINIYEERSSVISDVLTEAKVQAEKLISDASQQAASVIKQAEDDAVIKKRAAENVYQKEVEQQIEQLMAVKVRMNDYLDMLDELQQGISKLYGSINRTITGIPTDVKQLKKMVEADIVDSNSTGEIKLLEQGED